jgi:hypothetical protein
MKLFGCTKKTNNKTRRFLYLCRRLTATEIRRRLQNSNPPNLFTVVLFNSILTNWHSLWFVRPDNDEGPDTLSTLAPWDKSGLESTYVQQSRQWIGVCRYVMTGGLLNWCIVWGSAESSNSSLWTDWLLMDWIGVNYGIAVVIQLIGGEGY